MPKLFERKGADDEVRVWVPGCAAGEEAYSIAILLREQMDGLDGVPRVQIFATDIDEGALALARRARYPANLVKEISPERLKRFFVSEGGSYQLAKEVRDMCIFSAHSVIRDPPFSRLDLISCRNLLIYLKPELQGRVIPLFHYGLRLGGYLFLGSSENVSQFTDLFQPIDRKNRIFQRRELSSRPSLPLEQFLPYGNPGGSAPATQNALSRRSDLLRKVANTILEDFAPVHVIVDEDGQALLF
jgi:two-component system CheB/CheR fusion protein